MNLGECSTVERIRYMKNLKNLFLEYYIFLRNAERIIIHVKFLMFCE